MMGMSQRDEPGGSPPAPVMEGEGGRFRLFDAVATFLRNAGASHPLMLILDDLRALCGSW